MLQILGFMFHFVLIQGHNYVAIAGLELAVQTDLELTESCPLCLARAGIKGVC